MDKSNLEFKLLIAILYNSGIKVKSITEASGIAHTTMKRWADALKTGDLELLGKALRNPGAPRKLTPEIQAYIKLNFSDIYKETKYNYSALIRKEIKKIFGEDISSESLRPIFNELKKKEATSVSEQESHLSDSIYQRAERIPINKQISFKKRDNRIYYFHGLLSFFSHEEKDLESFRFITSQLAMNGSVKQIEIAKAFGISYVNVKRNVKKLREEGIRGFIKKTKARSPHILTEEVVIKIQRLLDKGNNPSEIARKLNLKANTICKALQTGRLYKRTKNKTSIEPENIKVKSQKNCKKIIYF